jgi:hypothetical protein
LRQSWDDGTDVCRGAAAGERGLDAAPASIVRLALFSITIVLKFRSLFARTCQPARRHDSMIA